MTPEVARLVQQGFGSVTLFTGDVCRMLAVAQGFTAQTGDFSPAEVRWPWGTRWTAHMQQAVDRQAENPKRHECSAPLCASRFSQPKVEGVSHW